MTNTVWQQRAPVRKPPVQHYLDEGTEPFTDPEAGDTFFADLRAANEAGAAQGMPPGAVMPHGLAVTRPQPDPETGEIAPEAANYLGPEAPDLIPTPLPSHKPLPGTLGGITSGITSPVADRRGSALDKLEVLMGQRPVMNKPNWGERLAAGAAGGFAGWSNAAGRTRPIDIQKLQHGILHPGYDQSVERWESQVAPVQAVAGIEAQRLKSTIESQKMQSEAELKHAQAVMDMQHGEYWMKRGEQERNQWKIDPKSGRLWNTITGATVDKAQTPQDRQQIMLALGGTEDEAREYAVNGKLSEKKDKPLPNVNEWQLYKDANNQDSKAALAQWRADKITAARESRAPKAGPDPETVELNKAIKQQNLDKSKNEELDRIEKNKTTAEGQIQARRTQEINNLFGPGRLTQAEFDQPTGIQARLGVNRKYAPMLQNVQNNYASELRRRGHQADDYHIDPDTLQATLVTPNATPAPAPAAPATPAPHVAAPATAATAPATHQYTEVQVRQAAAAKGKDPEAAVAAARAKKLIP